MRSFYTDTVTRQRALLVDDGYGNQVEDWASPATVLLSECRWQPLSSKEVLESRSGSEITARLMAPLDVDIAPRDRIVYSGVTYEVEGEPLRHRSPSGVAAHAEVLLRRFDG